MDSLDQAGSSPVETENEAVAAADDNLSDDQGGVATDEDPMEAALAAFDESQEEAETEESSTSEEDEDQDEVEAEGDESEDEAETEADSEEDEAESTEDTDESNEDDGEEDNFRLDQHPKFGKRFRELNARMKAAEESAQRFERMKGYIEERGLSGDDVDQVIALAAALKNPDVADASSALKSIEEVRSRLLERTGEGELPQDLNDKVLSGALTEEQARAELRLRAEREDFDRRRRQEAEAQTRSQAEARQRQAAQAVQEAVRSVEDSWKSDPRIEAKMPLIRKEIEASIGREGRPQTLREVKLLMETAKAAVDRKPEFSKPKRKAVKTVTGGGTSRVKSEPKDAVEAALMAWENTKK